MGTPSATPKSIKCNGESPVSLKKKMVFLFNAHLRGVKMSKEKKIRHTQTWLAKSI
jgi:hypothetical protein